MIPNISPAEAKAKMDAGGVLLLDVREDYEVAHCRIEGSAHIPLGKVRQLAAEKLDKSAEIVVYCHHGTRSLLAAGALRSMGFEKVNNMAGGIDAWSLEIDPTVPRY